MSRIGLIFLAAVFGVTADGRGAATDTEVTLSTDRPAVTESSIVVPQGSFQAENGLLVTDTQGRDVLDLPENDLRYGLLEKTELRLTTPDYFHDLPAGSGTISGSAIGVKQQLGPLAGFDLSVVAFLRLPTGSWSVSSHGYDPGVQLPWPRGIAANWTVAGQFASYWTTQDGARNHTGEATLLVDRQLIAPWDAFIEYAGDFRQRGGSTQLLHVGTAYKLKAHHQIDLQAAVGLSSAAPRSLIGIGYSFLLLSR
jgi:Putative MetA-pathway of phenol degradation